MSENDLRTLAEIITKPHQKTENKKMWLFIAGVFSIILAMGYWGGDWHSWRNEVTDWKAQTTIEDKQRDQQLNQLIGENNRNTARKNSAVIVKGLDK